MTDDDSANRSSRRQLYTQFVPGHVHLKCRRHRRRSGDGPLVACRASSTRSPSTTDAIRATAACCTRCPAARSSPTPSNTWSTRTPPTRWCASPTATRSPRHAHAALRLNIPTVFVSGGPDGGRHLGRRQRRRPPASTWSTRSPRRPIAPSAKRPPQKSSGRPARRADRVRACSRPTR